MRPVVRLAKLACVTALALLCVGLIGLLAWSFYRGEEWSVVRDRVVQRQTERQQGFKTQHFSRVLAMRGGLTLFKDEYIYELADGGEDQPESNRWWFMHSGGRIAEIPPGEPSYGSMTLYELEPTVGWSWLGWGVVDEARSEPGLTAYTPHPDRAISVPLPLLIFLTSAIPLMWLRGHLRRRRLARRGFSVEPAGDAEPVASPSD